MHTPQHAIEVLQTKLSIKHKVARSFRWADGFATGICG